MKALLAMPEGLPGRMFDAAQLARLAKLVEIDTDHPVPDIAAATDRELADVEVLITGWGAPRVDAAALARMPRLRAVVHTAGTVRFVVSEAVWEQGDIVVTSSTEANAVPVAEFTLAHILLAGKRSLAREARYRGDHQVHPGAAAAPEIGNYGGVVGLIGASRIGTLVAEHLQRFDLEVLITDPFASADQIAELGASAVEPEELYARSDVVSLHAPDAPSTRGMVSRELLARMRDGTTFVNTARPALVDLDALREELVSGRLAAVLDVHDDLPEDDPIWGLENVSITPHIAGSQGNELHRMGEHALEEVRRLAVGEPPRFPVDPGRRGMEA
ncbi:hydroxyacid dehydrogenase [Brachybacterium fresconis]|uniref:Phosphoglycerate dehydrogenase-like enzyme n=1 Tax=Brachybacterium fresconis TaxID=173363 RepID=A0ABS4YK47_9MICO|nr:hydroxyacid dehydrogenase [Brachybacterium fresconis]MBP2409166.1 phosphoglycerate dehydrogenase-like enzyme [Brachybacterium fresconis]